MKKISTLLLTVFAAVALTSCLDSDEPNYTTSVAYTCYNKISNLSEGTITSTAGRYDLDFDFTQMTVAVKMLVSFTPGNSTTTLDLGTMRLTANVSDNSYTFTADAVTAKVNGAASPYLISNFRGQLKSFAAQSGSSTYIANVLTISCLVNSEYQINSIDSQPYFFADETKTLAADGSEFTTSSTQYYISFTDSKTADINILQAKFNQQMPQLTFVLKGMPVEFNGNGYTIQSDKVIPTINDVPFDKYALTNFVMNVTGQGTSMGISFNCTVGETLYTTTATGSVFPSTKSAD